MCGYRDGVVRSEHGRVARVAELSERFRMAHGGGAVPAWERSCDNPPRKIPYYRLRPIHFGHLSNSKVSSCR
jgi:hypothetical protein